MIDTRIRSNQVIDKDTLYADALSLINDGYISNALEAWPEESVLLYIDKRVKILEFRNKHFAQVDEKLELNDTTFFEGDYPDSEEEETFFEDIAFLLEFLGHDQFEPTGEIITDNYEDYFDEVFENSEESSLGRYYHYTMIPNIYTSILDANSVPDDYIYGKLQERECEKCNILRTRDQLEYVAEKFSGIEIYYEGNPDKHICKLCQYEDDENLFYFEYEDWREENFGEYWQRYLQDTAFLDLYQYSQKKLRALGFNV
jgi:hypothetical protein